MDDLGNVVRQWTRGMRALTVLRRKRRFSRMGASCFSVVMRLPFHHLLDNGLRALLEPFKEAIIDAIELGIRDEGARGGALQLVG